jgi:hypothetical protein
MFISQIKDITMDVNELLNKKIIELDTEEMDYLLQNATYGQIYEWMMDEHQRLRDMFSEIVYEINTMEMLNFINRDDDEE